MKKKKFYPSLVINQSPGFTVYRAAAQLPRSTTVDFTGRILTSQREILLFC